MAIDKINPGKIKEMVEKSVIDDLFKAKDKLLDQAGETAKNLQKATIQPTKVDAPRPEDNKESPAPSPGAQATGKGHLADLLTRGGQGTPA